MTVTTVCAWAICDTDGGRRKPFPLLRHIYPTEQAARQAAEYHGFDPAWYPVRPVRIEEGNCSKLLARIYRRWRCRRDYRRLSPSQRTLVDFVGADPDTLIREGML